MITVALLSVLSKTVVPYYAYNYTYNYTMPLPVQTGTKQKKKGRAPAHQNVFAFMHNPKSKKTEKILEAPIERVCRRCHEKLVWRKKYRKYKPRTQPGTCNFCRQKRVMTAYHTICSKCTTCDAAWKMMRESKESMMLDSGDKDDEEEDDEEVEEVVEEVKPKSRSRGLPAKKANPKRCCAICVKEIALPDEGGADHSIQEIVAAMGPMSLRQRRGLERQLLREQEPQVEQKEAEGEAEQNGVEAEADDDQNEDDDQNDDDSEDEEEEEDSDEDDAEDVRQAVAKQGNDDEEDPFLKAVGGAANLLTGEAYQKSLLAKQKAESSNSS